MAGSYQPLATYGAQVDIPIQEATFQPGANDDDVIQAGRFGAPYLRSSQGFQSMLYLHDGDSHRVLAFWQDHDTIQRFHSNQRTELLERERQEWPESPWLTRLDGFRSGTARRMLMGPRMSLEQTDLVTPSPPAVTLVQDISGLEDIEPVIEIWCEFVPSRGIAEIQQARGFMFFSACAFESGDLSIYTAFRSAQDLEAFLASSLNTAIQEQVAEAVTAQSAESSVQQGRLLAWTVRQLG